MAEPYNSLKSLDSPVTIEKGIYTTSITVRQDSETELEDGLTSQQEDLECPATVFDTEDNFPEGGLQAWMAVFGAYLMLFASFGFMVSVGTLQYYWEQNQLAAYSARDVGWIPSVFVYLGLSLGIAFGPAVDHYGPRYIALTGSAAYTIMIFLLAECQKYWQFMLCFGLLGGVSSATLTTTSLAIVAHWFKARRAFAQGVAMVGSSTGGLVIPLMLRTTLFQLGYQWSVRILGLVILGCLVGGNLLLRPRFAPSSSSQKKPILSLSLYRDPRFTFLALSIFGLEVVLFGALGILPTYVGHATNFPPQTGFNLIAILNGVSCIGRIIPSYVADRIGRLNMFGIMFVITLVFMLGLWLPFGQESLPILYAFTAIFGFCTGSWMALVPASIGQLCRADDFGRYYGTLYFFASLSTLLCIPISGELVDTIGPQALVGFASGVLGLTIVSLILSRWACLGWKWDWTTKI